MDIVSRGPSNIFIAVCAIDADGNTQNKNEYIGPRTSIIFKPVNLPLKMIAPIYSVKINKSSAIQMGSIDPNISKFATRKFHRPAAALGSGSALLRRLKLRLSEIVNLANTAFTLVR